MVKTSRKRSYLVQLADHLIVEFALSLDDEEVFRDVVWPAIVNAYEWAEAEPSLESLWVLLQIHSKFPSVMTKQFVLETFKRKKFIDEQLAVSISQLVMVSAAALSFRLKSLNKKVSDLAERHHANPHFARRTCAERHCQIPLLVINQPGPSPVDKTHRLQHAKDFVLQDVGSLCHTGPHFGQLDGQKEGTSVFTGTTYMINT